MSAFVGV